MTVRLDVELVRRGLVRSRAEAVRAIAEGRVRISGTPASKPSRPVREDDELVVTSPEPWVARSAHKLVAALERFGVDPTGRLCLDIGASTGGFTQVLLSRGAREVIALDVGHGQLVPELRGDPRVRVVEGVNARELDAASLVALTGVTEPPTLVVVDVSFIPLALVLPAVARVLATDGVVIALIKPQFEVGRTSVRDGLVRERSLRIDAVRRVLHAAAPLGLGTAGVGPSPIEGGAGNREYLCLLHAGASEDPTEWESRLEALD